MHVDFGEHLGVCVGALSRSASRYSPAHRGGRVSKIKHYVIGSAATRARQHSFHGARRQSSGHRFQAWQHQGRRPSSTRDHCRFLPQNPCLSVCRVPPVQLTVHSMMSYFALMPPSGSIVKLLQRRCTAAIRCRTPNNRAFMTVTPKPELCRLHPPKGGLPKSQGLGHPFAVSFRMTAKTSNLPTTLKRS